MKKADLMFGTALFLIPMFFQACQKDETVPVNQESSILPETFSVEIPASISSPSMYKSTTGDTLQGNDIYAHLRNFIHIGEDAAGITGKIIQMISKYNLSQPMSFSFTGDDDGRTKSVVIIENSEYEGHTWQYQMTVTDAGDGSLPSFGPTAMQIFWDKNPVKGIAIISPYNIDRTTHISFMETMYRVDYSGAGEGGYEQQMTVYISGLPLEGPLDNPFSVSNLKMFAGEKGGTVSVYGNSEHPNAKFFTNAVGFDWAFAAAGEQQADIGVAEVGLPSNTLNASDRYTLLVENSIRNVFTEQIYTLWPWIDSLSVQSYLYNSEAPGFFGTQGFIQGGNPPDERYDKLISIIEGLVPYNPLSVHEMALAFKPE
ncbi:MAG: hypothetical protein JXA03_10860 [Bacteroidales bacterium]|nr:hypothetical protein [Bacteroidales bacterium]